MGRTKTKLNAPHVTYNATYNVPQQLIIRDRCQKKFREKITGSSFQIFKKEIFQNLRRYMLFKTKMQVMGQTYFFSIKLKSTFYDKILICK